MAVPVAHDTSRDAARDEGFTLIEVVLALVLLGMIAMASLGVFLGGMSTVTHMQRQQAAVAVANSAMDVARSVSSGVVDASQTVGPVKGRTQAAVDAVWASATLANPADTADMSKAWDPASGLNASDQWVPITTTARVDNITYTIDTLVGKCYRLRAASTVSENCVKMEPAPTGSTYMELYRIRVVVRWDESPDGSAAQRYSLSTLVDPSEDATWNTVLLPYAYDDEFSVSAGSGTTYHAVVANDSVDYNETGTTSAIRNLSSVTPGTGGSVASSDVAGQVGGVLYTAPSAYSGQTTFTYKVQGTSGERSVDPATVTVHVLPQPAPDNFYVASGSVTTINSRLTTNDSGVTPLAPATRKVTIVPANSPTVDLFTTEDVTPEMVADRDADRAALLAKGISVDASGNVIFTAPATPTTTTFYYYLVDAPRSGTDASYPSATPVEVRITTENTPSAEDKTYPFPATSSNTSQTIPWLTDTGNPTGTKIRITAIDGPGTTPANQVRLDGGSALNNTGTNLTFTTNSMIGRYTITYQTVSPSGNVLSSSKQYTVEVWPTAPATVMYTKENLSSSQRRYTFTANPSGSANDFVPLSQTKISNVTVTSGSCSVASQPTSSNWFRFTLDYPSATTCTVSFTVESTGTGTYLTPSVVSPPYSMALPR